VDLALHEFGDLHVVVNNAGILRNQTMVNMSEDDFDSVIAVHLKGTFAVSHFASLHWRAEAKAGRIADRAIVNTSSGSGLHNPLPSQCNYAAAKAGIAALTTVAAIELQPFHARANCVAPSRARTRATEALAGIDGPGDDDVFDPFHPGNVSPLVGYLASESCPFNGDVFSVHGGEVTRYRGWSLAEQVVSDHRWTAAELALRMTELPRTDAMATLLESISVLGEEGSARLRATIEGFLWM
jgi:NAD(P)-dependent dehydrogenase (short-subunit alcohol dehydrogenase family)